MNGYLTKNSRMLLEKECKTPNLSFYIDKCARKDTSIPLPLLYASEHKVEQRWTYLDPGSVNRIIDKYGTQNIHMIQFHRFVKTLLVEIMLKDGVLINGERFSILGCSSSGLKSRKCYLWRGTNMDAEKIRCENGDFNKLKTISKRMARFSLLLSNVKKTKVILTDEHVLMEKDIEYDGFNFTDGCGGISLQLARQVFKDVYAQEKFEASLITKEERKYLSLPHKGSDKDMTINEDTIHKSYLHTSCPSVFQIRYQGFKGVLAIDSSLDGPQNKAKKELDELAPKHVKVRPSMLKFHTTKFPFVCVCDYSKPYTFGNLNRQYIRLLASLGVPDDVFLMKQEEHFSRVTNMLTNTEDAVTLLQWNNQFHVAELLLWYARQLTLPLNQRSVDVSLERVKLFLDRRLKDLQEKLVTQSEKLRILVPKSRNLFGICEPTNPGKVLTLEYGQCFVRVTVHGRPHTITGKCVVSKNPCYLPGDVRVLEAVSVPELEIGNHLVDCLVFPVEGIRPHSAEIAGSDLDGDNFFVCWDVDLVPPRVEEPYAYPAFEPPPKAKRAQKNASVDDNAKIYGDIQEMITYFSIQSVTSMKVGKISNLYEAWADRKGANSNECRRLGQLFARVVDSAKSGERIVIPNNLKITSNQQPTTIQFVWQQLKVRADSFKEKFRKGRLGAVSDISQDFLVDLLSDRNSNLPEFTKFRLAMDFLENSLNLNQHQCFEEDEINEREHQLYLHFSNSPFAANINFGLFAPSEKGFAITEYKFPVNYVMNSLTWKSNLLSAERIFYEFTQKFQLDNENIFPWELYFQWQEGSDCRENNWQELIFRAINQYSDVLVAIQVPDDVCFIIRFRRDPKQKNVLSTHSKASKGTQKPSVNEMDLQESNIHATSYFYSPRFIYALSYHLYDKDSGFKVDFVDNVLQLYRGEKGRTFIQFKMKEALVKRKINRKSKNARVNKKDIDDADSDDEENHRHSISVDLTRFDSTVLTNQKKGRHPLVRKTPVIAVETFVFNRKNNLPSAQAVVGAAYLDVVRGNHLHDVHEDAYQDDTEAFSDEEDSDEALQLIWLKFESILRDHALGKLVSTLPFPQGVVIDPSGLIVFLEQLSFEFKTKSLTRNIEVHVSEIVNCSIVRMTTNISLFVKICRLLCGLGLLNVAKEALNMITACYDSINHVGDDTVNEGCIFKFSSDWKLLASDFSLCMSFSMRLLDFVAKYEESEIEKDLTAAATHTTNIDVFAKKYAAELIKTEYSLLIQEFLENRKRLKSTNIFHSRVEGVFKRDIPLCIDTPETIGNLILDSYECVSDESIEKKKDGNEITLYRLAILPFKIRHWIGQYVVMTKQARSVIKKDISSKLSNNSKNNHVDNGPSNNVNGTESLWTENDFPALAKDRKNNSSIPLHKKKSFNVESDAKQDNVVINDHVQESVACIARVIKLQEAPFTITLQVVPSSDRFASAKSAPPYPNCIKECIDGNEGSHIEKRSCKKWRLSLIQANVVTFSRVMDALKTLSMNKHEIEDETEKEPINLDDDDGDISHSHKLCRKGFAQDILPFLLYPSVIKEDFPEINYPDLRLKGECCDHEILDSLNASQRHAVEVARSNRISLVHGPPGTGKTTTACAIVHDIKENLNYSKILICAETNLAVDNLAIKFIGTSTTYSKDGETKLSMLRLNSRQDRNEARNPDAQSNPELQKISLESKLSNRIGEPSYNRTYLSRIEKKEVQKIISESDIVFTTCAGAGDPLLDRHQFEFVLIDEATMTKESTSLCALMHGCRHFVLIGDPNQLGPNNSIIDQESSISTLFHKFCVLDEIFKTAFLDTQHRMHPSLVAFPSREFYDSKLKSADGLAELRSFHTSSEENAKDAKSFLRWWPIIGGNLSPMCFVDVGGGEERRIGTSFNNTKEAYILSKIWLGLLLSGAVDSYTKIAILTLYKGQVSKLRETFTNLLKDISQLYPLAKVDFPTSLPDFNSVDSYQGRENEVVLVTTVRSGDILGFSGDRNRLNVLLTRAKRALCVIGNKQTLMISPFWEKWLSEVPCVLDSDIIIKGTK